MQLLKMEATERADASRKICESLMDVSAIKSSAVIAGFWPTKHEVDLRHFLVKSMFVGRAVCLPKVTEKGLPLEFHNMSGFGFKLATGYSGILEPSLDSVGLAPKKIDCILVPSISIDRAGTRLGSGHGFYDITIPLMPNSTLVAPIYHSQLVERLPKEKHDAKVAVAVTEKGIFEF